MSNSSEADGNQYSLSEISTIDDDSKPLVAILNYCKAITEAIQKLGEKVDAIDEKVTKLQNHRTRDFWNSEGYRATVPPYRPEKNTEDNENTENTEDVQNTQGEENMDNLENPEGSEQIGASYHSEGSQELYPEFSESDLNSTPRYHNYDDQSYEEEYLEYDENATGASAEAYSDHSQDLDMGAADASAYPLDPDNLPPGELIPIRNPEMRRLALLEAQRTPPCDPTSDNEDIISQCNLAVMEQLYIGDPTTWNVEDVLQFLYRVDAPMADYLFNFIRRYAIDGNALLLLTCERMVRFMGLNLGIARRLSVYIDRLKEVIELYQ